MAVERLVLLAEVLRPVDLRAVDLRGVLLRAVDLVVVSVVVAMLSESPLLVACVCVLSLFARTVPCEHLFVNRARRGVTGYEHRFENV